MMRDRRATIAVLATVAVLTVGGCSAAVTGHRWPLRGRLEKPRPERRWHPPPAVSTPR